MNPERWQQVKQALDEAIALPVPDRSAYLDSLSGRDPELRREVDSLLSSYHQAGTGFMKTPAVDLTSSGQNTATRTGRRIGVYQIIEEIGHGGMGEVYRASRVDGVYEKQVAIKLVRGGLDTGSVLERFRNERQILASLDHPNIAHLLDGGTTDDGIPYLVMELVEGTPIDEYCDRRRLSISERLRLFRQVCSAVQYAHQRLVIHRDLKPSNILVSEDGTPKLLDFGIAKLLDPTGVEQTTLTQAMTPDYASPEQIRGEPITTATDVYSLGVVLYQLLAGRSPYPAETRSSLELARAICETDPGRPSTVVLKSVTTRSGGAAISPETVSLSREGSPARLRRRLEGDLDDIVLKALRKELQRRYASVEQLSEDIRRHLEGLPVTATKGSRRYRARKFVTRHKTAVAATAIVVLALVGGVAATVRAARIARQQAEIARAERERAEKRFNDVRKLANSLIFEIHDSIQSLPGATPSRKLLLDRAVEYLDKLSQDSSGDVDLQRELAFGYQRLAAVQGNTSGSNLGQIHAAEISNSKAIALFESVAKANPKNVKDQINLAMIYRLRAFTDVYEPTGRQEIEQALNVTAPLMQASGDNLDLQNERALELQILASVQDATGDRLQAADSFRQYLAIRQEMLSAHPDFPEIRRRVAKGKILLAVELRIVGQRAESMKLMSDGISDFEALVKAGANPDVLRELAASEGRRAQVEVMNGDFAGALLDDRHAEATIEKMLKLDPQNEMLGSNYWSLVFDEGRVLAASGKNAEGLAKLQAAFKGFEDLKLEADTGPGDGIMQSWIAEAQVATGNLAGAMQSYQKGTVKLVSDLPKYDDAHCELAAIYTRMGATLVKMGKLDQANEMYKKAIETASMSTSLDRRDFPALYAAADAYAGLGGIAAARAAKAVDAQARAAAWKEARGWYEKSQAMWQGIPNPSHISPSGYRVSDFQDVPRRLAECKRMIGQS